MARKSDGRGQRTAAPTPAKRRSFLRRLIVWFLALVLLAAIALGIAVQVTASSLPDYTSLQSSTNGQMIVVRAADGTEIASLGPSYGQWVPYDQIPQVMKDAILSTEDRRFRSHVGVDPIGVLRSVWVRAESGSWRQGGSTITQQLARTVFLNNNRTFARKLREGVLALALERRFTKDQILELYLNKVYFGGGAYGIDAASRKFFNHPATNLNLPEAAIIAGLVKAPSNYAPTADPAAAISRANVVIGLMQENGVISPAEARAVNLDDVHLAPEAGQNSVRYFTDWALPQLDILLPDNHEPIEVWTTLDPHMQQAATESIHANAPAGAQGALVSLDRDGAVLAMVGGTDYVTSNYNRAVSAERQPGSAWKLFVYLAALEAGYKPDDRVVDEPVTIAGWSPRNSNGQYAGPIDVRTAFAYSKNTVAAQLGSEVGFPTVASMARRFGITTPIDTNPSMVLGTSDVRVIDMTRAFAAIQGGGVSVVPYGIRKVTTTGGRLLYTHQREGGTQLVPTNVAAQITDLLQTAVNIGTGRAAQIGRPVAGKTGTTSSNKDGWFLGFSSGITTGVWMGRDDAKAVPGLQGGTAPARAFAQYMRIAVANRPTESFETQVTLPQWQLEPDDEAYYGDPDDYYYNGAPGQGQPGQDQGQEQNEQQAPDGQPDAAPQQDDNPEPAANDDFLDQATGRHAPQRYSGPQRGDGDDRRSDDRSGPGDRRGGYYREPAGPRGYAPRPYPTD